MWRSGRNLRFVPTRIHLNFVRHSQLAGLQRGPPKHNQTEELSSQHVIFMLLWTTAADLRSCLNQQSVQGSNLCTHRENFNDYNILVPTFVLENVAKSSRFMWVERNVSGQLSERGGTLTATQCEGLRMHSGQTMPFNTIQKPFL